MEIRKAGVMLMWQKRRSKRFYCYIVRLILVLLGFLWAGIPQLMIAAPVDMDLAGSVAKYNAESLIQGDMKLCFEQILIGLKGAEWFCFVFYRGEGPVPSRAQVEANWSNRTAIQGDPDNRAFVTVICPTIDDHMPVVEMHLGLPFWIFSKQDLKVDIEAHIGEPVEIGDPFYETPFCFGYFLKDSSLKAGQPMSPRVIRLQPGPNQVMDSEKLHQALLLRRDPDKTLPSLDEKAKLRLDALKRETEEKRQTAWKNARDIASSKK